MEAALQALTPRRRKHAPAIVALLKENHYDVEDTDEMGDFAKRNDDITLMKMGIKGKYFEVINDALQAVGHPLRCNGEIANSQVAVAAGDGIPATEQAAATQEAILPVVGGVKPSLLGGIRESHFSHLRTGKAQLLEAPYFRNSNEPELANAFILATIHQYFGNLMFNESEARLLARFVCVVTIGHVKCSYTALELRALNNWFESWFKAAYTTLKAARDKFDFGGMVKEWGMQLRRDKAKGRILSASSDHDELVECRNAGNYAVIPRGSLEEIYISLARGLVGDSYRDTIITTAQKIAKGTFGSQLLPIIKMNGPLHDFCSTIPTQKALRPAPKTTPEPPATEPMSTPTARTAVPVPCVTASLGLPSRFLQSKQNPNAKHTPTAPDSVKLVPATNLPTAKKRRVSKKETKLKELEAALTSPVAEEAQPAGCGHYVACAF